MKINIVSIPVSNQQASKKFYMDILGFEIVRENPMGKNQTWVELILAGAETSISLVTWFDNMPAGTLRGIVIETGDLEEAHAELKSKGLDISNIDNAPWGSFATFADPDGNGWVLQQAFLEVKQVTA